MTLRDEILSIQKIDQKEFWNNEKLKAKKDYVDSLRLKIREDTKRGRGVRSCNDASPSQPF